MWSGFNLMANLKIWKSLPQDIKDVIERNATKYVRLQRADQQKLNEDLRQGLETHGVAFNAVDGAPFRARLAGVYAEWKGRLGTKCWGLLEETTGRLG
jgi:TRAP-type C4-dicarboxylate transport system substrate-binding protein